MKKFSYIILSATVILGCQQQKPVENAVGKPSDKIYQYSLFTALANSIYDGTLTVAEVKKNGNLGLGTYNGLNGEMIVNNGKVYQFLADGTVIQPGDSTLIPFTVMKFFQPDYIFESDTAIGNPELKKLAEKQFSSLNFIYALKVSGTFSSIKCGSAEKQEMPYQKTLSEAIANRPVFEWNNIQGTLVGFWFPEYVGSVNIPGFHLHFISTDETKAGHVLEFQASKLKIEIDQSSGLEFDLPETNAFKTKVFDLTQGYNKPLSPTSSK